VVGTDADDAEDDDSGYQKRTRERTQDQDDRLRGGKMMQRDRWGTVRGQPDFKDFKRYYHRVLKRTYGSRDLTNQEQEDIYEEWVNSGRPTTGSNLEDAAR